MKIIKQIKFNGSAATLKQKKLFPETVIHNIFETSFHVK